VNLSPIELLNPNLSNDIKNLGEKYGIKPDEIVFEITEEAVLKADVSTENNIDAIRKMGYRIAIDDFGTGYSTLNVLKDYNITTIKLDKSLLDNVGTPNSKDDVIVRNVVKMANELNKEIFAEGVETETQAEYLKSIQCNNVQGFLFDKPLVHDDFQKRLTGEVVY
jgi:EAL domain-containing protein (putative c-di-GMP-specific phosphodiesterase class I)